MMYSALPLPLAALAFVGGYWTNLPQQAPTVPTRDLAASMPHQSAMTAEEERGIVEASDRPADEAGRRVDRASDGLFYVRAKVNGRSVRFMVDTGASVVVLSSRDARALGAAPKAGSYAGRMATAGGSRPMAWTRLGEVRVAGRTVHGVTAAVVTGGPDVSLLGQNLLSKLGAVRIEGDSMEFESAAG